MALKDVLAKYNIPKELEHELDLSDLDGEKNPLRTIYSKISDKLEGFAAILEDLIHPNTSMATVYEISAFSEEDKKRVLKTFKKIMQFHRTGLRVDVVGTDKAFADFINSFWKEWSSLKKDLVFTFEKMEKSWEGDSFIKVELGYLG